MTSRKSNRRRLSPGAGSLPARYRRSFRALIHFWAWTLLLIILWPLSILVRELEKLRHD